MTTIEIDRDEYEAIQAELSDVEIRREGDVTTISGKHEDHGQTLFKREDGRFFATVEEGTFVRPKQEAI